METNPWINISGVVEPGHRVASGESENSPYPEGTIEMQIPYFKERGLDLSLLFRGTLNISISPYIFKIKKPEFTFKNVNWTDKHPPENFSFSRCEIIFNENTYLGWVYYPHPETKKTHFQEPSVIEILAPQIPGLSYGSSVSLLINTNEIAVELE